jgi:hypothetical protein
LIHVIPVRRAWATRWARDTSPVHTPAPNPNGVLLAIRTPSASEENGTTVMTGPKTSSRDSLGSSYIVVPGYVEETEFFAASMTSERHARLVGRRSRAALVDRKMWRPQCCIWPRLQHHM